MGIGGESEFAGGAEAELQIVTTVRARNGATLTRPLIVYRAARKPSRERRSEPSAASATTRQQRHEGRASAAAASHL